MPESRYIISAFCEVRVHAVTMAPMVATRTTVTALLSLPNQNGHGATSVGVRAASVPLGAVHGVLQSTRLPVPKRPVDQLQVRSPVCRSRLASSSALSCPLSPSVPLPLLIAPLEFNPKLVFLSLTFLNNKCLVVCARCWNERKCNRRSMDEEFMMAPGDKDADGGEEATTRVWKSTTGNSQNCYNRQVRRVSMRWWRMGQKRGCSRDRCSHPPHRLL
eukprot:671811-Rhodomonas_salina.2